jgi:hypothetical protein
VSESRPCPPCANCGVELHERYWGQGRWMKMEPCIIHLQGHGPPDCMRVLKSRVAQLEALVEAAREFERKEWIERLYASVGEGPDAVKP